MTTTEVQINAAVVAPPGWRIDRRAAAIAWPLWSVAFLGAAVAAFLILATFSTPMPARMGFRGWVPLAALLYATVGARIATRRSGNPIGWLFLGIGMVYALNAVAEEYGTWSYYHERDFGSSLDGAAWFAAVAPNLTAAFGAFAYLLFPDGALVSRRWRPFAAIVGALALLTILGYAILPNTLQWGVANQLSLPFLRSYPEFAIDPMLDALYKIRAIVLLAPLAAVFWRIRSSKGVVRQQLKWVGTAGAFTAVAFALNAFFAKNALVQLALTLAILSVPIAFGIAMRRYRLYDIDVILNRAVVWGTLTATLAGVYVAAIGVFTELFKAVTDETSDVAIVVTTLVVAGAFMPAKTFLQAHVEQWFPDPTSRSGLRSFTRDVEMHLICTDRTRLLSRFLDESVRSLGATGGRVALVSEGAITHPHSVGRWSGEAVLSLTLRENGAARYRIELGPRENGAPYTEAHYVALRTAGAVVQEALTRIAAP